MTDAPRINPRIKATMTPTLTVYGSPASQPARAVYWTCLLGDIAFTLGDARNPDLPAAHRNPRGQVPWIIDGDFKLAEMGAIVCYLADEHGVTGLYPRDLRARGRINQYLHMQHTLVRAATTKLMAPHVIKPIADQLFRGPPNPLGVLSESREAAFAAESPKTMGGQVVHTIAQFLEANYFGASTPYVCGTSAPSVADLACYGELGQLPLASLFDFSPYPRLSDWLAAMGEVRFHDAIHVFNTTLGDIATKPNTMERFTAAIAAGMGALENTTLASSQAPAE
jgi:glutathione S-transferase